MPEYSGSPRIRALLDENMPPEMREWLRARKPYWEVWHVYDVGLQNQPDEEVFEWALSNGAMVITFDVAFADGHKFPVSNHYGIIRLRVWPTTPENTEDALERLFDRFQDDQLSGSLIIVRNAGIRRISGSPPEVGSQG